jgi:hypothetical protein
MLLGMKTCLLGALFTEVKKLAERVSKLCQGLQPLVVFGWKRLRHVVIISYYDIFRFRNSSTIAGDRS